MKDYYKWGALGPAIYENSPGIAIEDLKDIVLEITGENDGSSWHWIVSLNDGEFAYVEGWCDYTGWD